MPGGRPTVYKDEFCERVEELGLQGKHAYQIATDLRVSINTLYRWADEKPQFREALTCAITFSKCRALEAIQERFDNPDSQAKLVELNAKFMNDIAYSREFDDAIGDPLKLFNVLLKEFDRGNRSAESVERIAKVLLSQITAEQEIKLGPKIRELEEKLGDKLL